MREAGPESGEVWVSRKERSREVRVPRHSEAGPSIQQEWAAAYDEPREWEEGHGGAPE